MQYGYKISGFASSERFFEAERYLDKKLRGWTKGQTEFLEDGSRRQVWTQSAEDGSTQTVELVKNVTESAVLVFSDIELKWLMHGGVFLYVRDLPLMAVFAAVYFIGTMLLKRFYIAPSFRMYNTLPGRAVIMAIMAAAATVITLATTKPVMNMRTKLRARFVQMGGVFAVILGLSELHYIFTAAHLRIGYFFYYLFDSPVAIILTQILLLYLIGRIAKRRK